MSTAPSQIHRNGTPSAVPALQPGDHLDQPTFHARYEAMPEHVRAELIGGIVYMPSPVKADHGDVHGELITWLTLFKAATPGTRVLDNATQILGDDSEPQPDAALLITGGQTRETDDGYIRGAPEFVAEVALSTESYDLHSKKRDYEHHGVREYVVCVLRLQRIVWFVRQGATFAELSPDAEGIYRSPFIKGLWLDAAALLRGDTNRVHEVLNQGLASTEHAEFARSIKAS